MSERDKLLDVALEESSLAAASANAAHERRIAMFDLIENNSFAVDGADRGPYKLALSPEDGRLLMVVADEASAEVCAHAL